MSWTFSSTIPYSNMTLSFDKVHHLWDWNIKSLLLFLFLLVSDDNAFLQIWLHFKAASLYISYLHNLFTDARREGRKALVAFSSDDAKTAFNDAEPVDLEQSVNDDGQLSRCTPVWIFLSNLYLLSAVTLPPYIPLSPLKLLDVMNNDVNWIILFFGQYAMWP